MESKKKNKRPKPYDEMSTTGALSSTSAVERSYRPIARPARKPTADQQELIDYVERLKPMGSGQMDRPGTWSGPSIEPRTMGERMRDAGAGHQGRPAKKFADGGMVRGCKPGQSSGTKFTGTF